VIPRQVLLAAVADAAAHAYLSGEHGRAILDACYHLDRVAVGSCLAGDAKCPLVAAGLWSELCGTSFYSSFDQYMRNYGYGDGAHRVI
jgi:hypothetical protein